MSLDPDELRYQEAMRRYQVDVASYEEAVAKYKEQLHGLKEGDPKPPRPIPPILPVKPVKFRFADQESTPQAGDPFNEGVEAAALALEEIGEAALGAYVRGCKKLG